MGKLQTFNSQQLRMGIVIHIFNKKHSSDESG